MSEENVEIVRQLHEAFARGENQSPFAVYDPDIEWDMSRSLAPLPGEEAIYHGHDGVRRYWRAWLQAWETIDAPVERVVDAGEEVVVLLGRATLRGKMSGAEVEIPPWAQVWTLREGKVIRMRLYPDHAEGLKAAGLRE
jgi:ketosteroid isomerase-like protein